MGSRDGRGRLWRSRWAAIGAAVAVTFGAGGLVAVNAAGGVDSTTVMIDPVRVLDSRDTVDVGLAGPFSSQVPQKLQITGSVPTGNGSRTVVPPGATGVLLNVTTVNSTANGFISIRPGDATGLPSTSSLNFNAGQIVPNAVLVALPVGGANDGEIDITYDAYGRLGPTTDLLIDVVGYTNNSTLAANTLRAAGFVTSTGAVNAGFQKIGNWTVTRTGTGVYGLTLPGFDRGCDNFPQFQVTPHFVDAYAYVSNLSVMCDSGDASVGIFTKNNAGTAVDASFAFQAIAGAEPTLAAGLLDGTVCTFNESGMTCE
jgi:hypothetical protein